MPSLIPAFESPATPRPRSPSPSSATAACPVSPRANPQTVASRLARDIGNLFTQLHRTDPNRIPPCPGGYENEPWERLQTELAADAPATRALLPDDLLPQAEPYLTGLVPPPPADGPRRFVHNDICPDHLIVDATTGRLTGLIDFTDALVGEVVLDFVGLIGIAGYPFIHQAAAAYELPLGAGFTAKLEWLCRTMTLTWLADSATRQPHDIPKHLSWVTHAFHSDLPR